MVQRVRELGFLIWFDDFGTGWSALQDLLELPVDGIKIDRSFAASLGTASDGAIVRALVGAAAELGLKVTIEGVETPDQARLARESAVTTARAGSGHRPCRPTNWSPFWIELQQSPGTPFPRASAGLDVIVG